MSTILAAQLSQIAANSNSSLNLKAQKAAHSKSLIFEARVAASQGFDTLYTLCHEGFQELCLLDGRFLEYQRDIFSDQSQEQDRTQMTAQQNLELDRRIESFLGLVGGRLRLNPAVKAVEWLIRRFRIHEHSTSFLLTTFLPYHTLPIFTTLLSILPAKIPEDYKFLHPYIRSLTEPGRHTIVQAATNNASFASILNSYVIRICNHKQHYPALLAFWAGVMTEAVGGMMDKSRSGRRNVQQQNEQDVILRLLPTLNEGLAMKKVSDLRVGCYMLLSVMASKGGLDDRLLTAMMEAVVLGWTVETITPGLVCLSVLAQHRGAKQLTKRLTRELLKIPNIATTLVELSKQRRVDKLANGFCLALVDRLRKDGDVTGLPIIESSLANQLLSDPQSVVIIKALLLVAHQLDDTNSAERDSRSPLATSLVTLTSLPGHMGSVVQGALKASDIDMDELELKLQTSIRPLEQLTSAEDVEMEGSDVNETTTGTNFQASFQNLPATTTETSFLSHDSSRIYPDLCRTFLVSTLNPKDLDSFDAMPILRRESALEDTLYLTFYMRTWSGPYPVLARASALQMTTRCLLSGNGVATDTQAILPYAVAALGDPASRVRRAAAELLVAISNSLPTTVDSKKKVKQLSRWAASDLYGHVKEDSIKWISTEVTGKFVGDILVHALEECVLDSKHIESVFQNCLGKGNTESLKKADTARLPQAARTSIMAFFASHIVQTPLISVKFRLLRCFNTVRNVAGSSRTKFLLPVLHQWADMDMSSATKYCQDEQIDISEMDDQTLNTIVSNEKEGLQLLSKIIGGEVAHNRPMLLKAAFKRLRAIWTSLKEEFKLSTAQMLIDSSQLLNGIDEHRELASQESADFLRTVILSTGVLKMFLDQLPTAAKLADKPPATKRRRTSHGEVARTPLQDSDQLTAAIKKVTFVLQLVHSSEPGSHPELLRSLFDSLAELQHFKAQVSSELAYLQGLVLECLLAILKAQKTSSDRKVDRSAIRADLLIDCIQKTASPQVQNAALLLVASLAENAPELVLHSVMPIFTFMGNSVLRQNDEYSAHVINQTICEVIPPLISSLRKEKGNPITGAAELLLSFVAAYEHVPPHRRKGLFVSLVQTLGAEDFLFALLAMLIDKYGLTNDIKAFAVEISGSFSVEVQLQSSLKYIDLVSDILRPKPTYSTVLLGANDERSDPYQVALNELSLLPQILSQPRLVSQTAKLLDRDDMDAARVRDVYSALLEKLLTLADSLKEQKQLHSACGDILESLLGLLSTNEFVKSVESLLDRPNESLRRKILRSLEVRIDQESASDAVSRAAMLGFLPQLTAIIRESKDVLYKHIAVACVDKISEKYGKKDIEAVAAAAETIASVHCLGQPDARLRVMALLCLASLVEILREGIVSVLPVAIPTSLEYMEASINNSEEAQKLHNAGFAFIGSLVQHLPYMVSGGYLEKLLEISNSSAEADLDDEADENRVQCLQLAAKQIDAKSMFGALEKNWERAADLGPLALREYLQVLSISIDKHPKSVITKHSQILAKIFQNAFDLRRQWTFSGDPDSLINLAAIEGVINEVAIKMIYKFNDATFRPIFAGLVEWATSGLSKKDKGGRTLRLQSIYGFMVVFFDNLKSIVTSYTTYLIDSAVDILKNVNSKDKESRELWARVLRTLQKCFEHDQDDFWQSPTHFDVVAPVLCEQFTSASSLPLALELVPAIVELAAAADSTDHHKELNGAILKHMRSETASVRLAAVKCQQELTDRLGEEWLSMLPEMLPFISELQEDDDDVVERETHRWIVKIEDVLGESLDSMLQ